MANQIPAVVSAWRMSTRLAVASSTTFAGSQRSCATWTATTGTPNVAVRVAYAGPVLEVGELGGQLLDLAADLRSAGPATSSTSETRLAFARDVLERGLAGPEVLDPRLEVDDLAGDLDGLGLLGDDLGRRPVSAAQQVERVLPAGDRDAIGDRWRPGGRRRSASATRRCSRPSPGCRRGPRSATGTSPT